MEAFRETGQAMVELRWRATMEKDPQTVLASDEFAVE
jgi:hypothetical protein